MYILTVYTYTVFERLKYHLKEFYFTEGNKVWLYKEGFYEVHTSKSQVDYVTEIFGSSFVIVKGQLTTSHNKPVFVKPCETPTWLTEMLLVEMFT